MRSFSPLLLFAAALWLGAPAGAQTASPPPTPAPAGGTPEQMPFTTPYGAPITAERAVRVVNAVLAEARKHPTWRFAISVVDPSGELVYFYKMDDTQLAAIEISQNKARTAARFRRETRVFYNAFEAGHHYLSTFGGTFVASPGGYPLIEGGKLIGAVGCGGGTGDQDAMVCGAGAASVK